jgi:hypothetical protein
MVSAAALHPLQFFRIFFCSVLRLAHSVPVPAIYWFSVTFLQALALLYFSNREHDDEAKVLAPARRLTSIAKRMRLPRLNTLAHWSFLW